MTLEEINKQIEELESKKNAIILEEKAKLEEEKNARKKEVEDAYDKYIELRRKYINDYGTFTMSRHYSGKDILDAFDII